MPQTNPPSLEDAEKIAALRRVKLVATLSLAGCVAVFLTARAFQAQFPWLSFVAAFAEAAAIGGLADWYAVVALFRHPLGLPIPHTAIIPANRDRIADNLGQFIETNFLAPGPVEAKLREVDFAAMVAEWLSDRQRAKTLSGFVARLVPQMLASVDQSGLKSFAGQRVMEQIGKIDTAPLAAELLSVFTENRRHQKLLDEVIKVVGRFLADEEALAALREKIRDELPSVFNLFRADAYLLKRIVGSAGALLDEIRADADHPIRDEFDRFVRGFIRKLKKSPRYAARAERLKQDLMARPELRDLAEGMWTSLRNLIEADAGASDSALRRHLGDMFVDVGRQLARDPQIRADMNAGFVAALASFVRAQKSGVSAFIADQVRSWDLLQLTRLIELNIGRDLQYIRFNGMLIGGIAGLLLHIGERLIFGN